MGGGRVETIPETGQRLWIQGLQQGLSVVPTFQLLSTIIFTGCLPLLSPSKTFVWFSPFATQSILFFCLSSPGAHPAAPYCFLR